MTDAVTPVQELRDRYFGCIRSLGSGPNEFTPCEIGIKARNFFDQWVRDSKTNFEALSSTEKRGLTFADYFRIVAPDKDHSSAPQIAILDLDSHQERNTLTRSSYTNGFLFDYDPAKNYFSFEKGDSGTALYIFAGFPVAVLSTIDGEPTSGGASILPLPESQEEKPISSPVTAGCHWAAVPEFFSPTAIPAANESACVTKESYWLTAETPPLIPVQQPTLMGGLEIEHPSGLKNRIDTQHLSAQRRALQGIDLNIHCGRKGLKEAFPEEFPTDQSAWTPEFVFP